MEIYIRVFDQAGNKVDYFIGPAAECPPIPQIGHKIEVDSFLGVVTSVEHISRNTGAKPRIHVVVTIRELEGEEEPYSALHAV
jgi:hypothetical protein